jgi:glycosyltransferase involved in cell wall biosynthesis
LNEVLIVDHHQDLAGGGEASLLRVLPQFDRERFTVRVACVPGGTLAERIQSMGVDVIPLRVNPEITTTNVIQEASNLDAARYMLRGSREFASLVAQIRGQVRRGHVDLIYTNSLKSCVLSALAVFGTRTVVVHHMHDITNPDKFNLPMLVTLKWTLKYGVKAVVSISDAVTESLANIGVPREKIHTIHNGIDPGDYPSMSAEEARKQIDLDPGVPVVGHVARFMRWKGQDFFLRAASRIKSDARFVLVGGLHWEEADYEKELHRIVEEKGLQDKVVFLGHRDDIPQVMRAFDILAHTSTKPEPFGLALIEAMASEKPVVAFKHGGIPEIVVDGESGVLTAPLDEEEFAIALEGLLSDPRRAAAMGAAGRERIERLFTLKRQSEQIQACFSEALGMER